MQVEKLRAAAAELERQLGSGYPGRSVAAGLNRPSWTYGPPCKRPRRRMPSGNRSNPLKPAVEKFEGSHPTLTGTLMRLIDGLGEMGI